MTSERVLEIFREAGALLEGHFLYTSGRHGRWFVQAARVLQHPRFTEILCGAIARRFADDRISLVVGPATGGIVLAYETARALNCRAAYTEKDGDSAMALKRGFALKKGDRVLVVEDVATTGGSVKKTVAHLRSRGAEVVGVSVLIDRSGGEVAFDCRYEPLARLPLESWHASGCPLCSQGDTLIEPDNLLA